MDPRRVRDRDGWWVTDEDTNSALPPYHRTISGDFEQFFVEISLILLE